MNKATRKILHELDGDINRALRDCTMKMAVSCKDVEESLDSMGAMIDVVSQQHQAIIWALIGSLLEMRNDGDHTMPDSAFRKTVHQCIEEFSTEIIENIISSCESAGYPNIFDVNSKVREEILNGDL